MKKLNKYKFLIVVIFSVPLSDLNADNTQTKTSLINYDSTPTIWQTKLCSLASDGIGQFRIIQLGDSHTASDFFTGELRNQLQKKWGNAGIGWVYPGKVSGQRINDVQYDTSGWYILTSRKDKNYLDFPMGGIVAKSLSDSNKVTININDQAKLHKKITAFVRPVAPSSNIIFADSIGIAFAQQSGQNLGVWQQISFYSLMPMSYHANGEWEVGEINIENSLESGIILSAMGINGSELSQWSRWRSNWMQEDLHSTKADLVIISYGTNEAFNSNIDISATEKLWESSIEQIKKVLPMAGILIIGAPETLKSTAGACGVRAPQLDNIQKMQQRVAIKEKTLYWSWQEALGGSCSMKNLMLEGLARKDGVHFTQKGYNFAADQLADELIKFANK